MSADHLLAASVHTFSLGRLGAATGALLGLAGVVMARPTSRPGAVPAMAAGMISLALGGLVAATAPGGLGTGNGLGGAYVALLVGVAATVLGGWALSRSRRTR
ncbi:hypothetical protein HYE82_29810 [Streptomyces sp. BR123]|uniref:DUF6223 family protein n=1 Tax=Streptomyces sp. BR123 TaxID=2749828 RepID=UPI0015C44D74|nr:DUF6223 family protein [Streptomyces sp. BR123]NXY98499.1 hypothetical protein [Streptomyces sp. BR123]